MTYKSSKPDGTKRTPPPSPHSIAIIGGNLSDVVDEDGNFVAPGKRFEVGDSLEDATPDERRELIKLGVIDPEHPTSPELDTNAKDA